MKDEFYFERNHKWVSPLVAFAMLCIRPKEKPKVDPKPFFSIAVRNFESNWTSQFTFGKN